MPWSAQDAPSHTRAANTPKLRELWAKVANQRLEAGEDEGTAIREANAAVHKERGKGRGYRMIALGLSFWTLQGCEPCAVNLGGHCYDHEQDDETGQRDSHRQQPGLFPPGRPSRG